MNKLKLTILFLFMSLAASAQRLAVESLKLRPNDLSARKSPRVDLNGKQCALIKVMVMDDITACSWKIGNVENKGIVKFLYVTTTTSSIELSFSKHNSIVVDFPKYGIPKLDEASTYDLMLVEDVLSAKQSDKQSVKEEEVLIDGKDRHYTQSELASMKLKFEIAKKRSYNNQRALADASFKNLAAKGYVPAYSYAANACVDNDSLYEYYGMKGLSNSEGKWFGRQMGDYYKKKGDYKKAFVCYDAAKKTWAEYSYYNMGVLYENGLGVDKDIEKAKECYRKSFMAALLGMEYTDGYRAYKRLAGGNAFDVSLFKDADEADLAGLSPEEIYRKGRHYEVGFTEKRDPYKAFAFYKAAADRGVPDAMESIAKMYKNPLYGLKDTVKANYYLTKRFEYYEAKVAQNEVEAFSTLAGIYEYGNGVAKDIAKAKDLYLRGANLGSSHCHYCLAGILKREDNPKEAFKHYKTAAEIGHGNAMYSLAHCYKEAYGTEADDNMYVYWLKETCKTSYYLKDKAKSELRKLGISIDGK